MTDTIEFTPAKLEALKKQYEWAVANDLDVFEFEGHKLVVDYAKYLIQYLDGQFSQEKNDDETSTADT